MRRTAPDAHPDGSVRGPRPSHPTPAARRSRSRGTAVR